mgnify:CR=1 FL=1
MEVQISQDIRKYKTKDIGNFSFKEAGFVAVGLAAAFLTYKLAGDVSIAFIPLAIVLIIGFFKPPYRQFPAASPCPQTPSHSSYC